MLQKLSLKHLAIFLQICIFISLIISLSSPIIVLKENFPITLLIDGKLWSMNFNKLSVFSKSFIILVSFLSSFIWLYALSRIYNLCEAFKANDFFSFRNLKLLQSFALSLVLISLIETLSTPLITYFLYWMKIIPKLADLPFSLLLEMEVLTVGIFFFLITKIMEKALNLDEENKLTV